MKRKDVLFVLDFVDFAFDKDLVALKGEIAALDLVDDEFGADELLALKGKKTKVASAGFIPPGVNV